MAGILSQVPSNLVHCHRIILTHRHRTILVPGVKHITITESDEPITLPDCDGMIELHDALRALAQAWRAEAESTHTYSAWGATRWMENALYDLWGVVGELARAEKLLDDDGHDWDDDGDLDANTDFDDRNVDG